MGIPSYFISLLRENPKLLNKFNSNFITNGLYFDSNSIIYDVIRNIESDKQTKNILPIQHEYIYKKICEKISYYINIVKPLNEVFISFDGVAPAAKMEQQRQRRYKSQIIKDIKNKLGDANELKFDTNQITPGTTFMDNLCKYINKYFKSKTFFNKNGKRINIILSLSNESGEGEHKIYNYIRNNNKNLQKKYITSSSSYNHLVYGLDSDLIMLSLINQDKVNSIYLMREAPDFINKINKTLIPNSLYYTDFTTIRNKITYNIHCDDYVLLSFILGNDFLPHNPAFNLRNNGIEIVMNCYKETFRNTIGKRNITLINKDKREINNTQLRILFVELSKIEEENIKNNINRKLKFAGKPPCPNSEELTNEEKLNFIAKMNFEKEHNIFNLVQNNESWKKNYYNICFNFNYSDNVGNFNKMLNNYLDALYWNFDYYTQNKIDVFWKYNYHHAPLLGDLIKIMGDYNYENKTNNRTFNIYDNPILPQTQLAYVLPKESHIFIKKRTKNFIEKEFQELINHKINYDYIFSTYLWEGHLSLNYIDIHNLNNKIKELK
jgi:5'-3' exoribonuclease 1